MGVAISAHRGGPGPALGHSTWETYEAALTSGAEYAEFDIRRTADGVYVAHHDAVHQGRKLSGMTYRELCAALGFEVPRIPELMRFLGGRLKGHLDLKESGYEAEIVDLALDAFGPDGFVATGIEDEHIPAVKAAHPEVLVGLSLGRDDEPAQDELHPVERVRACGADWVAVRHDIARLSALGECAEAGIGVMVWTVDDLALMDAFLADPRVDVLITNLPEVAAARRGRPS